MDFLKDYEMAIYILTGVLLLGIVLIMAVKGLANRNKQQDSVLKQRALFNIQQQLTYTRLQEIMPKKYTILVHVSFDALLTTKLPRTRDKYRHMIADFVVVDDNLQVVSVIAVDDVSALKKMRDVQYEDDLLRMAGYQVIRYDDVPEYQQLRQDFNQDYGLSGNEQPEEQKKFNFYPKVDRKLRVIV